MGRYCRYQSRHVALATLVATDELNGGEIGQIKQEKISVVELKQESRTSLTSSENHNSLSASLFGLFHTF